MNKVSVSELAVQKYQERQNYEAKLLAEKQAKAVLRITELAERVLTSWGIPLNSWRVIPDEFEAKLVFNDGLILMACIENDNTILLSLVGVCQECGESCRSSIVYNLEDIGRYLVNFEPDFDHLRSCKNS